MTEFGKSRVFQPRITNVGSGDFSAALPLPRIPVAPLDDEDQPRAPNATDQLLERLSVLLDQTDVSYL